jgi:hypothetical protein
MNTRIEKNRLDDSEVLVVNIQAAVGGFNHMKSDPIHLAGGLS